MRMPILLLLSALQAPAFQDNIIAEVRGAIARSDFDDAEKRLDAYQAKRGITAEVLEAQSWLGRGALNSRQYDRADAYAGRTHKLALAELKKRPLDLERHLPIALGAAIEVQARVMEARGERSRAVSFLTDQLRLYHDTSIRTRIQKNLHLLSLEGKPAPRLEVSEWLGSKPLALEQLRGKAVLLFFWAHWCGDCKHQVESLRKILAEFGPRGLVVIGPTQRYGYTARGEEATPEQEMAYIDRIRRESYGTLGEMAVPVSEENFKNYGCSTTPTLVFIDRGGTVRLYHPGRMDEADLRAVIARW